MSDVTVPLGDAEMGEAQEMRFGESLFGRRAQPKSPYEALQPQSAPPPPPPPRRRRRSPILSAFSAVLSFLVVMAVGAALLDMSLQRSIKEPGPLGADRIVMIPAGSAPGDIADQLEQEGVIGSKTMFQFAALRQGKRSSLKAGEYVFKQQASLQDALDTLVSGKAILHSITIPEGLTSEQIVARLKENDVLSTVCNLRDVPKEGTLLPETYRFARGMSCDQLLQVMAKSQKSALDDIWKRRASDIPVKSPYELVTLASIVEKETGRADERPHVASVFANRLGKRMRLQSDPTIIYGLVGGKGTLGRGILKSEVEQATPYNTYAIEGLPPGPIANPGKAAMEAVANPSRTKDLFFVADGTGGHAFAETLDQHNKNVVRWRSLEKDAKERYQPVDGGAPPPVPGQPHGALDNAEHGTDFGALPSEFAAAQAALATALSPEESAAQAKLREVLSLRAAKKAEAPARALVGRVVLPDGQEGAPGVVTADRHSGEPRYVPLPLPPERPSGVSNVAGSRTQQPPPAVAQATGGARAASMADVGASLGPLLRDLAERWPGLQAYSPDTIAVPKATPDASESRPVSTETYPVSERRRAEQKAKAAQYGLLSDGPFSTAAPLGASDPAPAPGKPRGKILDASEGTAFDPLKNHDFDLTSPKNVPSAK